MNNRYQVYALQSKSNTPPHKKMAYIRHTRASAKALISKVVDIISEVPETATKELSSDNDVVVQSTTILDTIDMEKKVEEEAEEMEKEKEMEKEEEEVAIEKVTIAVITSLKETPFKELSQSSSDDDSGTGCYVSQDCDIIRQSATILDEENVGKLKKTRNRRTNNEIMHAKLINIMGMVMSSDTEKAIVVLEKCLENLSKDKKKREATEYNKFVQTTMSLFKGRSGMSHLDKIRECSLRWQLEKLVKSV